MGERVPVSIRGLIIAAAWTPKGDVAAVDIAGYDEKRYRVIGDQIGRQLRSHIKKRATVDGVIDAKDGALLLRVKRFHIDDPDGPI